MNPFSRYVEHLERRATGVPRRQWRFVASGEALWYALPSFALLALAQLLREPQRTIVFWTIGLLFVLGLAAMQTFILVMHLKDYRARTRERG